MTRRYPLSSGVGHEAGWVEFDWDKDVEAARPRYQDTLVVLKNGRSYLLRGRTYGV